MTNYVKDELIYKKYRKTLIIITISVAIYTLIYSFCTISTGMPDNITVIVDKKGDFDIGLPLTADFSNECVGVISVNNKTISDTSKRLSLSESFSLCSSKIGEYKADIKALGLFKVKKLNVKVIEDKEIYVGGFPIGIYMETDGLLVLGTTKVRDVNGNLVSPVEGVVKAGDYILALNKEKVNSKYEFMSKLANINNNNIKLTIRRGKEIFETSVKSVVVAKNNNQNEHKLGIWVRNDMQGIGTLSYYDRETNSYAALGHGVNDIDTSTLMRVKKGYIYDANIADVVKGKSGNPGELVGIINYSIEKRYGNLIKNSSKGIYGVVSKEQEKRLLEKISKDKLDDKFLIALKQDIKTGPAIMRCQVGDDISEYKILIKDIDIKSEGNKSFVIKIVDKKLLQKTGGIVQGMSGSPIIQEGKIVGALTHVFVNDSSKGYGIFIENMLN